eukprot:GILJ01015108.1.p2 GENE.GILJ01015108.1~~GILJ01015108.1.p2  ORF type:complete len:137 (-),score=33.43 GILJ01015108.1:124-534(-)
MGFLYFIDCFINRTMPSHNTNNLNSEDARMRIAQEKMQPRRQFETEVDGAHGDIGNNEFKNENLEVPAKDANAGIKCRDMRAQPVDRSQMDPNTNEAYNNRGVREQTQEEPKIAESHEQKEEEFRRKAENAADRQF